MTSILKSFLFQAMFVPPIRSDLEMKLLLLLSLSLLQAMAWAVFMSRFFQVDKSF